MAMSLETMVLVFAVLGLAPWAVYVGGLAALTAAVTDGDVAAAFYQDVIMLEWYTVAASFATFILVAVLAKLHNGLRRSHTFLNAFLMCNSALIIYRATFRIVQINKIEDGFPWSTIAVGVAITENPLPYLRAEVAGQICTAFWNFVLVILISLAGTSLPDHMTKLKAVPSVKNPTFDEPQSAGSVNTTAYVPVSGLPVNGSHAA